MRSGNRTSSPYAIALAVACATGADSANAAATMLEVTASAADPALVPLTEHAATNTAAGATTRTAVSPNGRGDEQRDQPERPRGPQQDRRDDAREPLTIC